MSFQLCEHDWLLMFGSLSNALVVLFDPKTKEFSPSCSMLARYGLVKMSVYRLLSDRGKCGFVFYGLFWFIVKVLHAKFASYHCVILFEVPY